MSNPNTEYLQKLMRYCAYQERCHVEVWEKMKAFPISYTEKQELIDALMADDFLNEVRFAETYARSKHRQQYWGPERIRQELKARQITDRLIDKAIKAIGEAAFAEHLQLVAEKKFRQIENEAFLPRRKKCCDYLLRKGYESSAVYETVKALEKESDLPKD